MRMWMCNVCSFGWRARPDETRLCYANLRCDSNTCPANDHSESDLLNLS
jgi:hypothetical protein